MVESRNRLVQGKLAQEFFAYAPCPQPRLRNTSTTSPRCASGAASRCDIATAVLPPHGKEVQIVCMWAVTTRATWWNGWNGCGSRVGRTSITATSSAHWCASPVSRPLLPGAVSHHDHPADLRRVAAVARQSVRRGPPCDPSPGRRPRTPRWTAHVVAAGRRVSPSTSRHRDHG